MRPQAARRATARAGGGGSKKPSLSRFPQLEGPLMGSPCALVAILHVEQEGKEQERGRRRGREKRRRRKKNAAEGRTSISKVNGCGQGVWPTAQLWEKSSRGREQGGENKKTRTMEKRPERIFPRPGHGRAASNCMGRGMSLRSQPVPACSWREASAVIQSPHGTY